MPRRIVRRIVANQSVWKNVFDRRKKQHGDAYIAIQAQAEHRRDKRVPKTCCGRPSCGMKSTFAECEVRRYRQGTRKGHKESTDVQAECKASESEQVTRFWLNICA